MFRIWFWYPDRQQWEAGTNTLDFGAALTVVTWFNDASDKGGPSVTKFRAYATSI